MQLRRLHPDSSLRKSSLAFWRRKSTRDIIASLVPGNPGSLKVKPNGLIMDGNTRIKVLQERGFAIDTLPFESYP